MRYPAAEQLEIIRLVEQSRLPVRRTLDKLGILPARLYRWYNRYQSGGYEALKDRPPRPKQAWNRIPDDVRGRVLRLALDAPALSPRELATRCIDTAGSCVSEASGYRRLKAHDLITSPAFGVIKAANAFKDKTVRPNQLWQTDFTYLKVSGWGWLLGRFARRHRPAVDLGQHAVDRFQRAGHLQVRQHRPQPVAPVTRRCRHPAASA